MARQKEVDYYGLADLGYADSLPLSGDYSRDQLAIERFAFRIGHSPTEGGLGKFEHFRRFMDLIYNRPGSYKKFLWHDWSEWAIRKFCEESEVGMAGSASSGKTAPAAFWAVGNYLADPTHVKVFCFSTTIKEAKDRIWKEVVEYWNSAPEADGKVGKHNTSLNQILGLSYSGKGFGTSSGIYLYAADKSNETTAYNSLIGSKVAKTGSPVEDPDVLLQDPEFRDLVDSGMDEDLLRDLVLRLQEVSADRRGKIIIIIDEATGVSEKLLDAYLTNLKPGNEGRVQIIVIGNPSSPFDTHGKFCEPAAGRESINETMTEWRTVTGGVCIHFDGRKNPRIVNGDERLVWMPTEKANEDLIKRYGENSMEVARMLKGFWAPVGAGNSIYSDADLVQSGALSREPVVFRGGYGDRRPEMLSGLDPAYTMGGDRASASFERLGIDQNGLQVLEFVEEVTIKADINKKDVPVPDQILLRWKHECEKRQVPPENCCFDASGGGILFASIVSRLWSPKVRGVSSGGKASVKPLRAEKDPSGKPIRGCDKYANRATELWCVNVPFLRTRQLRGIPDALAKELCSRQTAKKKGTSNLDKIQIESKRDYKDREKVSPDFADSHNLVVDEAITRHGFRPSDTPVEGAVQTHTPRGDSPWEQLKARARAISNQKRLKKS